MDMSGTSLQLVKESWFIWPGLFMVQGVYYRN